MLETIKLALNSTKFWSVVLTGVVVYLSAKGFIGDAERNLIGTVLGGYVVVNTIQTFQPTK